MEQACDGGTVGMTTECQPADAVILVLHTVLKGSPLLGQSKSSKAE
jgi:hypothetical protein